MRFLFTATAVSVLLLSCKTVAQERYATVDFTVEVTGNHRSDSTNGGYYRTAIKRIFRGTARLKYAGHDSIDQDAAKALEPATSQMEAEAKALTSQDRQNGAAVAAAMMKCAALEDEAAMQKCGLETANLMRSQIRVPKSVPNGTASTAAMFSGDRDLWATEKCSGQLSVADMGEWYGIDAQEGSVELAKQPYALNANAPVSWPANSADRCAVSLIVDNKKGTVDIDINAGPLLIEAKETSGSTTRSVHVHPLGWSTLNPQDIDIRNAKLGGNKRNFSGSWSTSTGKPRDLGRLSRNGTREVYDSTTKVSWAFRE